MPALSQPNGANIVSVLVGTNASATVNIGGEITAQSIDDDIAANGTRSTAIREWNRHKDLISGAGLDPTNLTDAQLIEAEIALYWACYALYYRASWMTKKIHHKDDKCEPEWVMKRKVVMAKEYVCEAFSNLGINDPKWCGSRFNLTAQSVANCFNEN